MSDKRLAMLLEMAAFLVIVGAVLVLTLTGHCAV